MTDPLFDNVYCSIHIDALATHLCLDCGCYCCEDCIAVHDGHKLAPLSAKEKAADLDLGERCSQLMIGKDCRAGIRVQQLYIGTSFPVMMYN